MNNGFVKRVLGKFTAVALLSGSMFAVSSCMDDIAPGNYYTFTGETVADFLENNEEEFSNFIHVLKGANIWGEMRTYGEYTCFAPVNSAFDSYLASKGLSSVDQLTKEECDTIAFTHIIKNLFYCTDIGEGSLPFPNMLDRYLTYTCDSTHDESGEMKVVYRINKAAIIIERDDSVQNGVVQIVDQVISPSNRFLPDVIKEDPNTTLFYKALVATHLHDSLVAYIDENYVTPSYDSITVSANTGVHYYTGYETECGIFPEKRYFKFTAFVETDSVFAAHGITTLDELKAYAKTVYDESYPQDAGLYDDDLTDRRNPLNRFVSYHLLPEQMGYNEFNVSTATETGQTLVNNYVGWAYQDIEDFFETMMPYSIMRISTPYTDKNNRYINRKGVGSSPVVRGTRVLAPSETSIDQTALNGVYHYLDDILTYDKNTRENTLNCRIRVVCSTMSPDFINSGARGHLSTSYTVGFKKGFAKNVTHSDETQYWVRYRGTNFSCFFGDEITIRGIYDISFRLPPVPVSGTYELRMYECTLAGSGHCDRGVVQIYLNGNPCGIPVDLTIDGSDSSVGWISDEELGDEASIIANDKALHNQGYMKAMDSYNPNPSLIGRSDCFRKIITTDYFYDNVDYWMRIRLVLDNPEAVCPFNTIELVPKSVYAGATPEDRH